MHVATTILNYITAHKDALLALVGGSSGVSVFVQGILHTSKVQGYLKSFFVSHIVAFLGALLTYAVSGTNYNVGLTYLLIWFTSQFAHGLLVNPVYKKYVLPFLVWLAEQKKKLAPVEPAVTDTTTPTFG